MSEELLYKHDRYEEEFKFRPIFLKRVVWLFVKLSRKADIETFITRVTEEIKSGKETGVHFYGRAVDLRDKQKHLDALYPKRIRKLLERVFAKYLRRKDGKPTLYYHKTSRSEAHWHIQIPSDLSYYISDPHKALELIEEEFRMELFKDEKLKKYRAPISIALGVSTAGLLSFVFTLSTSVYMKSDALDAHAAIDKRLELTRSETREEVLRLSASVSKLEQVTIRLETIVERLEK